MMINLLELSRNKVSEWLSILVSNIILFGVLFTLIQDKTPVKTRILVLYECALLLSCGLFSIVSITFLEV